MVDTSKYNDDAQRWRDKYFALSEEQEKAEQDYAAYLKVLQRALVRISLAADGQDKDLDKQLGTLRNMLRKEPVDQSGISNHLELIESALLQLDKQRSDGESLGLEVLLRLVEQLSELNLSRDKQKALKHYAKVLRAKGGQLAAYPALLDEYSRLQQVALVEALQSSSGQDSNSQTEPSKGFMARIFGGKPHEVENNEPVMDELQLSEANPAANTQQEGLERLGKEAEVEALVPLEQGVEKVELAAVSSAVEQASKTERGDAETSKELSPSDDLSDTDAVITALVELLEQLPLPVEERGEAEKLRDQLKASSGEAELEHVVEGAVELVLEALGSSQQEFEQFLLALDKQLAEINAYLEKQGQSGGERASTSLELNNDIRGQVGLISEAVGEATDLNDLKTSVQTQLHGIMGAMDEFVTAETQREQELEQQLAAMREKLDVIQSEAKAIRKKLHNETLRALTDTLTHIPNREAFDERFTLERERYLRYKHPICIAILDIDHFKRVNDNHGHLVGDRVLQEVARTIKEMVRKTDFVARYGGEEFVVILPETTLEQAEIALNKIREAIACLSIKALGSGGKVTLSAGAAAFQLGELGEELVGRADKALYQAKAHGRNRVELAV